MKTFQNKSLLSRTVSLTLTVGLCLSFCLAVKAADLLSYPIKTAIATEEKTQRGEITVEMSSGDSLRQADYQALRDTHKPVTLRFSDISWAMVPPDMGRRMKASSMDLWLVEPEKALVEAVCEQTVWRRPSSNWCSRAIWEHCRRYAQWEFAWIRNL